MGGVAGPGDDRIGPHQEDVSGIAEVRVSVHVGAPEHLLVGQVLAGSFHSDRAAEMPCAHGFRPLECEHERSGGTAGTTKGKADGTRTIPVSHARGFPGNAAYGFLPGGLDEAVSIASERGCKALGTVVAGLLVETLVADVSLGVETVLVATDLCDPFLLTQGHDEAAVAARKKASCASLLHETDSSQLLIRIEKANSFRYRTIRLSYYME